MLCVADTLDEFKKVTVGAILESHRVESDRIKINLLTRRGLLKRRLTPPSKDSFALLIGVHMDYICVRRLQLLDLLEGLELA